MSKRARPRHRKSTTTTTSPAHRLTRLPNQIRLGRGYNVRVALVTPAQLQEILEEDERDVAVACWAVEDMAIYVDGSVGRKRQWAAYYHELVHAVHDIAEINRGGI